VTDLTKMSPLEAMEWYDGSRLDFGEIKVLVGRGIVDTEAVTKILKSDLNIDDLVEVPDLEPTDENLRLLGTVGPEIMNNDRENAQDWAKLIEDYDLDEDVEEFRTAGRSPSFARKVMELINRTGNRYTSLSDYDLTRPYIEIAARVESGLTATAMKTWESLGIDLPTALKYEADGLNADTAERLLHKHGIERKDWYTYKDMPSLWIGTSRGEASDRPMPKDWATIDDLLDLYKRGYTEGMPWAAKLPSEKYYSSMKFTLEQARMLADAGMTSEEIARMWDAGSTSGRRTVENAPPQLLPYSTGVNAALSDETIAELIAVRKAGVRASHLQDYRWSGCHTLSEILRAVAAGINPARVKMLRAKYGYQKRWATDPKRIMDFDGLLTVHAKYEDDLKAEAAALVEVEAMPGAEIGSHPKGGFYAKFGKTIAPADTPAEAALRLLAKLARDEEKAVQAE
jgi:hypothetical protein